MNAWFLLQVNPEPWEPAEAAIGRRAGGVYVAFHPNTKYLAFQAMFKEEFQAQYPDFECLPEGESLCLELFLWRNIPTFETTSGRKSHGNTADATNMQKAIEDCLQGLVYKNDKHNIHVATDVVQQDPHVEGTILIHVYTPDEGAEMHQKTALRIKAQMKQEQLSFDGNDLILPEERGADGLF